MKKCIGIDLGTTNSVVTFKDAKLKTIRNRHKKASTPSVIVLKDDAFIVGEDAKMGAPQDAERTVFSVKRLIGGAMNDEDVQSQFGVKVRHHPSELEADIALKLRVANGTHTALAHTMTLQSLFNTEALCDATCQSSEILLQYLDSLYNDQILP